MNRHIVCPRSPNSRFQGLHRCLRLALVWVSLFLTAAGARAQPAAPTRPPDDTDTKAPGDGAAGDEDPTTTDGAGPEASDATPPDATGDPNGPEDAPADTATADSDGNAAAGGANKGKDADAASDGADKSEDAAPAPENKLAVGGALRFNYFVKSWDGQKPNRKRFGDFAFDTFRINVDGSRGPLSLSAEYRLYQGYHMLHHGQVGYAATDKVKVDVGVSQVPFGLLKYASKNWFFDITYYLGMEDDYDLGVRTSIDLGDAQVLLGFYKNSEGSYTGNTLASARYSYDVLPTTVAELGYAGLAEDRFNSETNQGNVRATYKIKHSDTSSTELGVSGRVGGLYNSSTDDLGYHWAAAAHVNGTYGPLNVQLQGIAYAFKPENPAGQDDTFVVMGAYDAPYMVAAEGYIATANIAYTLPVKVSPLDSLTFYNDYSVLLKTEDGFEPSHQNVTGVLVAAGSTYTYVDLAAGRNHPWLGPFYGNALAAGDPDEGWHARFNINIGWYF